MVFCLMVMIQLFSGEEDPVVVHNRLQLWNMLNRYLALNYGNYMVQPQINAVKLAMSILFKLQMPS